MLNSLKIRNGHLKPNFNSKIYEYEVEVSDVLSLVMDYDTDENTEVTIYGNDNLTEGESHVLIECYDGKKVTTYTLKVTKSETKSASAIMDTTEKIEVNVIHDKIKDHITPIISISTIITIIILYLIIFKKK